MKEKIRRLAFRHKELAVYTFLYHFDKLIAFLLPLSVLYISKEQQIYNDIEYIFSIANIAVVIIEFGIYTYFFYGYRISENPEIFVKQVKGYFDILISFYAALGGLLIPLILLFPSVFDLVFLFVSVRTLFLLLAGFFTSYFRLIDKPSRLFIYTIPVNLFSVIFIIIFAILKIQQTLFAFFIPEALLIGLVIIKSQKISKKKIKELWHHVLKALNYAWPIMLNILMMSYINNYAKIHAYNNMSSDDMFQLSFILRISLIIQMMHSSFLGYYSKQLFIDTEHSINKKIFLSYLALIAFSAIMAFVFVYILNFSHVIRQIKIDLTTFIIVFYVLTFCIKSFLELYFNKYNKTKFILAFSMISTALFSSYIFCSTIERTESLALIMLFSMIINLCLTGIYLKFWIFKD
jgi:O-antigen/teichoic acid export membrane protein